MLSYSTYSEAGGVGKSTLAVNLAKAHARAGLDPLIVPLDPQNADLSRLLGIDDTRGDSEVDNLVRHLIRRPKGDFEDLIVSVEGLDVVPEHNMLSNLPEYLRREKKQAEEMGEAFGINSQLLRVLREAGVPQEYDVLICDPPATEGAQLYNAIQATRSLVIPFEPSGKGMASVEGLESLVDGLEETLDTEIGVLAAVPNEYKGTNDQQTVLENVQYSMPEVFRERSSLLEGCWMKQCTSFTYVSEHRSRIRDHEIDTLKKFDRLARYLESQAGIEAPNPPEPGSLEELEVEA